MRGRGRFFALRVFLFAFGLIVLISGLLVLYSQTGIDKGAVFFTIFDAILLYEVLIGPLLVAEQLQFLTAGRIVSIAMAAKATIPFTLCTAGLMYIANMSAHPPIAFLWVAQFALLFGLCLALYFSALTPSHIEAVEQEERQIRANVDALRSSANQLAIMASRLDASDNATRDLVALLNQINEELRYLSPVRNTGAEDLEDQIASNISSLARRLDDDRMGPSQTQDAIGLANDTLLLISQRKALLN